MIVGRDSVIGGGVVHLNARCFRDFILALILAALAGCGSKVLLRGASAPRGLALNTPGNSKAAIIAAIEYRIPLVEVDVRRDVDGTMWLFHDQRVQEADQKDVIGRQFNSLSRSEVKSLSIEGQRVLQPMEIFRLIKNAPSLVLVS